MAKAKGNLDIGARLLGQIREIREAKAAVDPADREAELARQDAALERIGTAVRQGGDPVAAPQSIDAGTPITQTPVSLTPVREDVEPPSLTPVQDPHATRERTARTSITQTPVSLTGVTEIPVDARMWLNYPAVLNWVLDEFLPSVDHNAQAVMLRIFRLTLGFRRRNCLVSTETLARKTKLSEPTISRVLRALRADGHIETRAVVGGSRNARGIEFVLADKALPPTSVVERTPITQTGVSLTGVTQTPMKYLKNKRHEEARSATARGLVAIMEKLLRINRDNPESTREQILMLALDEARRRGIEADEREAERLYDELTGGAA